MSMTAEQIVDRRRLRRKLTFWRFAGIVALVAFAAAAAIASLGREAFPLLATEHIARVTISGFIADSRERNELLKSIAESDHVEGVIIAIDSSGGSTTGGEALFESIKALAAAKPTVATIGTVGASAAYMAALATDHVVARRSSITGSIGVLFQYPKVGELLDNLGIAVENVKSGPLKAEPTFFNETSPQARAMIAGIVRDSFNWFVDIVAQERGMDRATALGLADGRIVTGRQALDKGLIDAIGGEETAIAWLADEHGIDAELPVKDWEVQADGTSLLLGQAALLWIAQKTGLGLGLLDGAIIDRLLPEGLALDGLLSVWQGSDRDGL